MLMRILLLLLACTISMPALAQTTTTPNTDPIVTAIQTLDAQSAAFQSADTSFNGRTTAAERQALVSRVTAIKKATAAQVSILSSQLQLIDARIAQLGPVTPGVVETPDIRSQRTLLAQQRSTVDSAIKRGKLLDIDADQLAQEIGQTSADAFSQRMSMRSASPLSGAFWSELIHSLPRDGKRISSFFALEAHAISAGIANGALPGVLASIVIALVMLFPVRVGLRAFGRRYVIARIPGNRIRRSGLALWLATVGALLPTLAVLLFVDGLRSGGMIADAWTSVVHNFQRACIDAALISSLGGALLQRRQPSWRLIGISDDSANGLRPWTFAAAIIALASLLFDGFSDATGASPPAVAFSDAIAAIVHIGFIVGLLIAGGRMRARAMRAAAEEGEERADQSVIAFLSLATWAVMGLAVIALIAGDISLAYFLARYPIWLATVAAGLYLLLAATDDICSTIFGRDGRLAEALYQGFGLRRSLVDQFGVALSAVLRLVLMLAAAGFAFASFGSNVPTLFGEIGQIAQGVTIGQITISPGAILRAVAVLALGLFVVRGIQKWLTTRYLPATELDAGARNSIAMVARYTGLILAVLWSLASLGIGIERIALLLSALSVGIGFGLQAITQNFVSGLILLAERPVKIGDWVRIGDQEGDVKRISVRATEIQIADRSTLIVPNSELITKSIVNKTLADPLGRIQLQFSVPIGSDVTQVRRMVMAIYEAQPAVLDDPKPSLYIDTILDGRINFNGFAFVHSPRAVYATRSDIWFRLLSELPEAGIELGTTPQQVQWINGHPVGAEGVIGMDGDDDPTLHSPA